MLLNNRKWCRIQDVALENDEKATKRGEKMTIEEKANVVSKIFEALEIVPKEQKDQLAGIIIGYSMASQFKEAKGV